MFEVCLFDLDQTLLDTDDMEDLRRRGKGKDGPQYSASVTAAYNSKGNRRFYSEKLLGKIRAQFPNLKMGVFTRSPRAYAKTLLKVAYPSIEWDVVVAFEDVERTKPYGDGIDKAMWSFGYENISRVLLVGDGDVDIRAAYHAGCVVALDRTSWKWRNTQDNWRSLAHMPDAIIKSPEDVIEVLEDYSSFLPELERLLSETEGKSGKPRFDKINKFIPRDAGGDKTAFPVYACGRSFAGYESLKWRRKWHLLTTGIHDQKEADSFPDEWIQAVRTFIKGQFTHLMFGGELVVSVIPHRPGRTPRLEAFLAELRKSYETKPLKGSGKLTFLPDLLAYKAGVRSNSNDKLGGLERFQNVRDHLIVKQADKLKKGSKVLVIDDVSTTGATLIYAKTYLEESAPVEVTCLSIALNISNVLYE